VVNEVQFAYNSFGQLVADYQEHGGAVKTSTSPKVEYQYADGSAGHNQANEIAQIAGSSSHVAHDRAGNMTKVPKPDDWNAHFDLTYDAWNRLVEVMDGETTVAEYAQRWAQLLGHQEVGGILGKLVQQQFLQPRAPRPSPLLLLEQLASSRGTCSNP
jgi:hypothetical protein